MLLLFYLYGSTQAPIRSSILQHLASWIEFVAVEAGASVHILSFRAPAHPPQSNLINPPLTSPPQGSVCSSFTHFLSYCLLQHDFLSLFFFHLVSMFWGTPRFIQSSTVQQHMHTKWAPKCGSLIDTTSCCQTPWQQTKKGVVKAPLAR